MSGQIDDYEVLETVCTRDFRKVKVARNRVTGVKCLLKLVRMATLESKRLFQEYADILASEFERQSQLSNTHVWPARRMSLESQYTCKHGKVGPAAYLVLDWCQNGTFFDLLAASAEPLNECLARTYFHQLIEAVSHAHQNRVVHWNLKSDSLMLDDQFRIHLAEFRGPEKMRRKDGHTPPEAIYGEVQSGSAVDVFSCGYILFSWIYREAPFERAERTNVYYSKLLEENPKFWTRSRKNLTVSDSLKSLLASMLAQDPAQRPTISEIKAHPWYNEKVLTHTDLEAEVRAIIANNETCKRRNCGNKGNRFTSIGVSGVFRDLQDASWSSSDVQSSGSGGWQPPVPAYTQSAWKFSQIFVTNSPEAVWRCVLELLNQLYIENLQVSRPYKIRAECVTDIGKIAFAVRLLDCGDLKYCIDFTQESGTSFEFLQLFTDFCKLFDDRAAAE